MSDQPEQVSSLKVTEHTESLTLGQLIERLVALEVKVSDMEEMWDLSSGDNTYPEMS